MHKTIRIAGWLIGALAILLPPVPGSAQATPHRSRLILKDGSYQLVMSYRVERDRVVLVSAERGGQQEEIPLALVDLDATHRWEKAHPAPGTPDADPQQAPPPVLDPELTREEAERRALTPEVAPDLLLPLQGTLFAYDIFRGGPELVPLTQTSGDLNRTTSHNILRQAINPQASSHQILQLKGETAAVQLHVNQPALYLRVGEDTILAPGGTPLTVDTHGAASASINNERAPQTPETRYLILRVDVRQDARVVASFQMSRDGDLQRQDDVVETTAESLPGGKWLRLTPKAPLLFGEYALVEVLSSRELNLGIWDFGIHPVAPENRDVLKPEPRRPATLERRNSDLPRHPQ